MTTVFIIERNSSNPFRKKNIRVIRHSARWESRTDEVESEDALVVREHPSRGVVCSQTQHHKRVVCYELKWERVAILEKVALQFNKAIGECSCESRGETWKQSILATGATKHGLKTLAVWSLRQFGYPHSRGGCEFITRSALSGSKI